MAGTPDGGKNAAATNKAKYGVDFYRRIGALGGSVRGGKPKGFAARVWCDDPCPYDSIFGDHFIVQCAGAKGGRKSRRTKVAA